MSGYGPALARVQAEGLSPSLRDAAPWLAALVGNRGTFYDIGCADGALIQALQMTGMRGVGCDLSEALVEIAQSRGLPVRRGDARAAAIPPSNLILALGEVLCFRDDAGDSMRSLMRYAQSLQPGGAMVFDVIAPTMSVGRGWIEDASGREWHCAFAYERRDDALVRHTHVYEADGDGWRREDETHVMTICEPIAVETQLRTYGLKVERVAAYGPYAIAPGRVGFVARKPA